jgi:hypothetical protein
MAFVVTDNLTQPAPTLAFPDVCPKCGATIRAGNVREHFELLHRPSLGLAFHRDDGESFPFAFLQNADDGRWHVVVFDWPFQVVTIRSTDYLIRWRDTAR